MNFGRALSVLCLLTTSIALESNYQEQVNRYYNNHHDKKFVIGYHSAGAGFFSALTVTLNNLEWCERNGKTPVIYWGPGGWGPGRSPVQTCNAPYYQEEGFNESTNVWEYYFEPVSCEQYIPGDQICFFAPPGKWLIPPVGSARDYILLEERPWRKETKKYIDKYVKVKPEIMRKVETFYKAHMQEKKTIALHLRGTDKIREIIQITTEDMCAIANGYAAKSPGCQFLVCTDETSLLTRAKELLNGNVITYDAYRSEDGKPIHLSYAQGQSPAKIGEDMIIEALLMSRCDLFIHTCTNVGTGVMYFNPALDTVLVLPPKEVFSNCVNWPS